MKKKYVALDIGNVLCNLNMQPFMRKMSDKFNIPLSTAAIFLKKTQCMHDLGYTTIEKELRDWFGVKSEVTIEDMVQSWNQCASPEYQMLDMLYDLMTTDNLQIALLSNMGVEHALNMQKELNYLSIFDRAIKHLSCEVGARKPHLIYYQSFLLKHPEFKGCLYLDDIQENLDMGSSVGFQSHQFDLSKMNSNTKPSEIAKIKELILKS